MADMALRDPAPKYGLFESTLAAVTVGGVTGAAVTGLQRGWDPKLAAPSVRLQCCRWKMRQALFGGAAWL